MIFLQPLPLERMNEVFVPKKNNNTKQQCSRLTTSLEFLKKVNHLKSPSP